ncbi:MAG: single-stranded DNA-binding protein [Flavobacteriaceae bacterium]|nr:single-stranded DNA-binding protein [Flavobacteriaceae bacterium]
MSGSLNKVMLIGNLGDEVKIHYFDNQNCISRFSIATNESYTLRDTGERVTQTEWHRIVAKNKLAELCEKYLSKGDSVYVEGKIRTRKWNDNGVVRYQTEIHAETIQFLHTKNTSTEKDEGLISPKDLSFKDNLNENEEGLKEMPF